MDQLLSDQLFNLESEKLKKVMSDDLDEDIIINERIIYINLRRKKDSKKFKLRIDCSNEFPLEPADYIFVNPKTNNDDSIEFWPNDNQQAFKLNECPRWICLAGTKAYKNHHSEYQHDPQLNTLSQTVFHIFRQINGWYKVE